MKTPTITRKEFDKLYRRYRNMVRGVIYEYEKDTSVVSDLMHDVFLRAWERRDQYDPDKAQAQTWLHTIAQSVAANHVRDKTERSPEILSEWELGEEYAHVDYGESWLEQNYVDADDPEAMLIAEEEFLLAMQDLTPTEEVVYSLMWDEGLSADEVAERLKIARATVDVHVFNIRGKLS